MPARQIGHLGPTPMGTITTNHAPIVSYGPYFDAVAKLVRDIAAVAFAAAMHKTARHRLAIAAAALAHHESTWGKSDANQLRYAARFRLRGDEGGMPGVIEGIAWANALLPAGPALPLMGASSDQRLSGLLAVERGLRGAAALEGAQADASWEGEMAWTCFERRDSWVFEVAGRSPGEHWATLSRGENMVQAAQAAATTALCSRDPRRWTAGQLLSFALLVPVRKGPEGTLMDEVGRAVAGHAGAGVLAEELARYRTAGGKMTDADYWKVLNSHIARCGSSDIEVVVVAGMRPIVFYKSGIARGDIDSAILAVVAPAGGVA